MKGHVGFEELAVETTIGVYEHERQLPKTVFLDIKMELDLALSVQKDALEETIDYGCVMDFVRDRAKERAFRLIESLASCLCDDLLAAFAVKSVFVRVKKPIDGYPVKWAICELARARRES